MHFYQDESKEWHYLSQKGYEATKDQLPAICYATKEWIEDIPGKEWPEFDETQLLQDKDDESYPKYVTNIIIDDEKLVPYPQTSEEGIFVKEAHDLNPLIFYRLARPLKDDAELPALTLSNYQKRAEIFGFKVELTPDYSYEKNDTLISLETNKYDSVRYDCV
jgi:hypothetical protein